MRAVPEIPSGAGTITEILLSPQRGGAMISVRSVQALAGQGLAGDRHCSLALGESMDKNVTLIESEKIEEFGRATGLVFSARDARRNIITAGIELNALLGHEFWVGPVRVKALELCEPCSLLARRNHRAVLWGLLHKGGLRCQIIAGGAINVGDPIRKA